MKKIILLLLVLIGHPSYAEIDRKGNGGDTYAIEFVDVAHRVVTKLKLQNEDADLINRLEVVVKAAIVDSTQDILFLDNVIKDAINYPTENRIVFNRKAWSATSDERNKLLFVLHEYLGLMRIDDSKYAVSVKLLKYIYKNSVVCYSLAQNAHTGGAITGKVVLNLEGRNEVQWRDKLYSYSLSVNGHLSPAFFLLAVYDNDSKTVLKISTNLDDKNPYFETLWPIKTNELVGGHPITDITVYCM